MKYFRERSDFNPWLGVYFGKGGKRMRRKGDLGRNDAEGIEKGRYFVDFALRVSDDALIYVRLRDRSI